MKSFFEDFKKFIARGNVLELAIAVIMGGAFGKIVTSLVNDIIMPLVGILIGQSFSSLSITVHGSIITYGSFIQNIVDFLIIALCIFTFTKLLNKFMVKEEKKEKNKPKEKPEDIVLLEEIRDLLKSQNKNQKSK